LCVPVCKQILIKGFLLASDDDIQAFHLSAAYINDGIPHFAGEATLRGNSIPRISYAHATTLRNSLKYPGIKLDKYIANNRRYTYTYAAVSSRSGQAIQKFEAKEGE